MAETEIQTPTLSEEDWTIVAQLLESKQREIYSEIRHTDKRSYRDALHERLNQVERLRNKIPVPPGKE